MQKFNTLVFDESLSGTGTTWYSDADFSDMLGECDSLAIEARTTNVSGTSPTLTVQVEHSADNQNWLSLAGTAEINAQAIANDTAIVPIIGSSSVIPLGFVRLRVALGGTTPACRLKIYATGRQRGM
jgi:hypothetical protein